VAPIAWVSRSSDAPTRLKRSGGSSSMYVTGVCDSLRRCLGLDCSGLRPPSGIGDPVVRPWAEGAPGCLASLVLGDDLPWDWGEPSRARDSGMPDSRIILPGCPACLPARAPVVVCVCVWCMMVGGRAGDSDRSRLSRSRNCVASYRRLREGCVRSRRRV
jgi:hypothetical protein